MKRLTLCWLLLLIVAQGAMVWGEAAENPSYTQWAAFKVGTETHYKQVSDIMGNKNEAEIVYRLVELTPEKAIVEMQTSMTLMGNKVPSAPVRLEHPARVDAAAAPAAAPADAPKPDTKKGSEDVTVSGTTYTCTTMETTIDQAGSVMKSVIWFSDKIPGGLVKSETNMEKPMKSLTVLELTKVVQP